MPWIHVLCYFTVFPWDRRCRSVSSTGRHLGLLMRVKLRKVQNARGVKRGLRCRGGTEITDWKFKTINATKTARIWTFGFLWGLCNFFWSQRRALLFPIAKIELIITHDFLILFQISRSRKYLNSTPLEVFSNVSTQTARNQSPASHTEY